MGYIIMSCINVLIIFSLAMNHLLRGLDDWWLIGLLLVPAFLVTYFTEKSYNSDYYDYE